MENERAYSLQALLLSSELRWLTEQRIYHLDKGTDQIRVKICYKG